MSTYSYNLPFSQILADNIDALMNRIANRKASLIVIDGLMGEGKTTLAVEIMQYMERKNKSLTKYVPFFEPLVVSLENQIGMGGVQFQEKLQICHSLGLVVVTYDESGDFSKRGSITQFNQNLNRVFQTFRAYKILVILCLPSFNLLDNDLFLQGVPRLLINCHTRTMKQGEFRGYDLEAMFYLKKYMREIAVPLQAYSKVTPNFRGHFLNLPYNLSEELDKVSTKAKTEILSKSVLASQGLINVNDLMRKLNRSKCWVRNTIRKLNIKHKKVYKMVKYYEAETLEILENQLKK